MTRIGAKFLEVRSRKRLTLEEVSESTKIRKEFLKAIEEGDFKKLPSTAYAYGFVRNYAKFLGLNEEEAIALFKREFDSDKTFDVLPRSLSSKEDYKSKRFRFGRNFIAIIAIFLFIVGLIFFQYKDAIFNPPLEVISPKENQTIAGSEIEVIGSTKPNNTVYVDDQLVSINESGKFNKTITVFPGKTTIEVRVTNSFNKETEIIRNISVKPGY